MTEQTYTDLVKALRRLCEDPSSVQRVKLENTAPQSVMRAQWAVYYHRKKLGLGPIRTRYFSDSGSLIMRLQIGTD